MKKIIENNETYTTLDSLVAKTNQKESFLNTYNYFNQFKEQYLLFELDYLLFRCFFWIILVITTSFSSFWQYIILIIYQIWYIFFFIYHQPFKTIISFILQLIGEIFILFILIGLLILFQNATYWYILTIFSFLNLIFIFMEILIPILIYLYKIFIISSQSTTIGEDDILSTINY